MKKTILLLCVILLPVVTIAQIVEEEISLDETELSEKFEKAVKKFNTVEQEASILDFNELIQLLTAALKDNTITESQVERLKKCYEYRARAYFNLGEIEKSNSDIKSILTLDVEFTPSGQASRKFIRRFDNLKKEFIGYFRITTKPSGARIYIDDEQFGFSDTPVLKHRTGYYILKILKDGYEDHERGIEIKAGKTEKVSVELKRTSAALLLQTSPSDVEVYIDGRKIGSTEGIPEKSELEQLRNNGFEPEQTSGLTRFENIKPGRYRVELKKDCYTPMVMTVDLSEPKDYPLEPLKMEPSQGEIVIVNSKPDADVILNGVIQGKGNQAFSNICTGNYTVIIKFKDGKYLKQFKLKKKESVNIVPSLKPTLVYAGVIDDNKNGSFSNSESEQLWKVLSDVETVNIYSPKFAGDDVEIFNRGLWQIARQKENIRYLDTYTLDRVTNQWKNEILEKYDAEMLLVGLKKSEDELLGLLFHHLHAGADIIKLNYSTDKKDEGLKSLLDNLPVLKQPWLGMSTIDSEFDEGVRVIEVIKGSPSDRAGIKPGDYLRFLDGRRITDSARYSDVVKKLTPDVPVKLKMKSSGQIKDLEITAERTLITPEPSMLYLKNRLIAEIESGLRYSEISANPSISAYFKGILLYYLGSNVEARSELEKALNSNEALLDLGQLYYFLAANSGKMGDNFQREQYEKMLPDFPDARMWSFSGFPVRLMIKYEIMP